MSRLKKQNTILTLILPTVAWIDGEDPCTTDKDISKTSVNPCGIRFTLDNGFTYFLQNCGDSQFALYNNDGSFNHIASFNKATYNCDGNIDTVFRSWLF